ncbi:hypothetical protein JK636_02460 [Clostridium sp. YIM B02515]|uniref:Uncharacterized protein n=1 Tax=Clostridium rhizosphaerae TaxID=2803861 RepID=A0ABS1T5L4_9CLOT|nr:hypothetical protein [Clostridium rhizosphaerae]MBL4934615.1 hypothetical protein [Clostridium rhizosphaerae]
MSNLYLEKLVKNNSSLSISITKYDGSHPIQCYESTLCELDETHKVCFLDSCWNISYMFTEVSNNKEAIDGEITFKLIKGHLEQSNMSVNIAVDNWSKENYVLIPAAVYNGNRFKSVEQAYPPMLTKEEDIGVNIPITITDVPRLNIGSGMSRIDLRAGDMATPAIGFHAASMKRGFFLLSNQETFLGDSGISIEENEDRTKAVISLSAPAVRKDYKYGMCTTKKISDDRGYDFHENDEITLRFRLYFFDCADILELFKYFINIRKDLTGKVSLHNEIPFSSAWDIQHRKYNKDNWQKEFEFYRVSTADCIFGQWQTGWVGGGMNSFPLLFEGNELSTERSIKNLDFAFRKAQAPSGLFYGIVYEGKPYGDGFNNQENQSTVLFRKNADVVYFITKQLMLMDRKGFESRISDSWKDGLKKACDAFVRLWNNYGQFGQFVDIEKEEIVIGGTASAGIAPAALALAGQYLKNDIYLKAAKESAQYFYDNFTKIGITNGAPGEICQCPDSEAAFALLESYIVLYETTGEKKWISMAEAAANQCATWCMSYDYRFPEGSPFGKLERHSAGAVWANVQNKHAAPGICTLSGDSLFKLFRATGNYLYLELLQEIAHNISQHLSREDKPLRISWYFDNDEYNGDASGNGKYIPSGWMNERVNTSDWEGKGNIGAIPGGSCWCEVSNMLTYVEVPGVYIQKDTGFVCVIDHIEAKVVENSEQRLVVELKNPTKFSAEVKVLVENTWDMEKVLGQNAMINCQRIILKPYSSGTLVF